MSQNTTQSAAGNSETAKVYSKLLRDTRISLGAFKLFHALRSYRNKLTGATFPSQEKELVKEMGFNKHSLKKWTKELEAADYIWTEKRGQNHHLVYHFTTDQPKPEFKFDAPDVSRGAGLHRLAVRVSTLPRGAETCTVTNPIEPISLTKPPSKAPTPKQSNGTTESGKVGFDLNSLVGGLVEKVSVRIANAPSVEEVRSEMEKQFKGAGQFAESFHRTKTKDGWRDQAGRPINHWRPMARSWASVCERSKRGISNRR